MESNTSGSALSWMTELSRALDQGIQTAGTFLETNSALLANTLALDKLSEFDGVEARATGPAGQRARAHAAHACCSAQAAGRGGRGGRAAGRWERARFAQP
jgi:hypothetical protein